MPCHGLDVRGVKAANVKGCMDQELVIKSVSGSPESDSDQPASRSNLLACQDSLSRPVMEDCCALAAGEPNKCVRNREWRVNNLIFDQFGSLLSSRPLQVDHQGAKRVGKGRAGDDGRLKQGGAVSRMSSNPWIRYHFNASMTKKKRVQSVKQGGQWCDALKAI